MTREIKFRAWDTYQNKMIILEDLGTIAMRKKAGYDDDFANYTVMQYTGLKDKNGKEIYEGDILASYSKRKNWRESITVIKWEETAIEDDWGNQHPYCGFTMPCHSDVSKGFEIIGNIYENKELIK